jgi:OpgC protein
MRRTTSSIDSPCSTSLSPNAAELFVFLAGWSLSPLTLVVCFGGAFSAIHRLAPILADILCRLGRHSLLVFSVGSLLVAIARILDDRFAETALLPVAATIVGLATLLFTARFAERQDQKTIVSRRPRPGPRAAAPIEIGNLSKRRGAHCRRRVQRLGWPHRDERLDTLLHKHEVAVRLLPNVESLPRLLHPKPAALRGAPDDCGLEDLDRADRFGFHDH